MYFYCVIIFFAAPPPPREKRGGGEGGGGRREKKGVKRKNGGRHGDRHSPRAIKYKNILEYAVCYGEYTKILQRVRGQHTHSPPQRRVRH